MRIEAREIILHHRGRIALGIDGDEQRMDAIGIRAERAKDFGNFEQRGWAYVGAMSEPEEHQEWFPAEVLVVHGPAVLIGERKWPADGGDLLRGRPRSAPRHQKHDAEAHDEPGKKCRADEKHAGGARSHVQFLCVDRPRFTSRPRFLRGSSRRTRPSRSTAKAPQSRRARSPLAPR